MVEEADLQVRPGLAEHSRNQLELVVLDPHGGAFGRVADDASANFLLTWRYESHHVRWNSGGAMTSW